MNNRARACTGPQMDGVYKGGNGWGNYYAGGIENEITFFFVCVCVCVSLCVFFFFLICCIFLFLFFYFVSFEAKTKKMLVAASWQRKEGRQKVVCHSDFFFL